ncbi:MAG: polyprenyl synthetase family protein [Oscillospiraceae bacterium]
MNDTAKKTFAGYVRFIENELEKYSLTGKTGLQDNVAKAMDYSLEAGGKRIRPVLVLAFCNMCGGDYKKAAAPAAAIEMIHTFSLIHDDLPCMDDDDFRRGKPSCHKQFDEATAVLAGDALAIRPFEIIAKSAELSDTAKIRIIAELANSSGAEGMIGGQIIDIENEKRNVVDEENLHTMYLLKTGKLIKTSCVMGCIAAGADDEKIKYAEKYAECLGMAFQVIDDILDVTGNEQLLGKPVGSDAEENKTTFVTIFGIEKAREEAEKYTKQAMDILDKFDNNEFLKELTEYMLNRNY